MAGSLSYWVPCDRCGGQAFWVPPWIGGHSNVPGEWACLQCGFYRDETKEEVLFRTGKPQGRPPVDDEDVEDDDIIRLMEDVVGQTHTAVKVA
jgi:hypothetical protein